MAGMDASNNKSIAVKGKKFLKETKSELKKVTWPTKEQLIHNTGIILVFIIVFTIILSVIDFGFQELFSWFTSILG